ncbi:MAG: hypothetical protein ACKV2T_04040 [Kofleriaceae bacterium]
MHVIKAGSSRRTSNTDENELPSRATGRMQVQRLIDLIDEIAPEEGVVDVHEIEARFADGSRRIPLVAREDAAVCAVVEGTADTTRRMNAVDLDAVVAITIDDVADTTRRMSAVQADELAAMSTPEPPVAPEPRIVRRVVPRIEPEASPVVVKFCAPTVRPARELSSMPPFTAPAEVEVEVEVEHAIESNTLQRSSKGWIIGGLLAVAGAAAGLAAVLLS